MAILEIGIVVIVVLLMMLSYAVAKLAERQKELKGLHHELSQINFSVDELSRTVDAYFPAHED